MIIVAVLFGKKPMIKNDGMVEGQERKGGEIKKPT